MTEAQLVVLKERERCALIAQTYPLEGFAWDARDIGMEEVLRLRDTISEAIRKSNPGERIT